MIMFYNNFHKQNNEGGRRGRQNLSSYSDSSSSAGGTSLRSKPSAGKSEVRGPKIPSELRVSPLCNFKQEGRVRWFSTLCSYIWCANHNSCPPVTFYRRLKRNITVNVKVPQAGTGACLHEPWLLLELFFA